MIQTTALSFFSFSIITPLTVTACSEIRLTGAAPGKSQILHTHCNVAEISSSNSDTFIPEGSLSLLQVKNTLNQNN